MASIVYLELLARDLVAAKSFYSAAFGCKFIDYGPSYSGTEALPVNIGLQGDVAEAPAAPLAVINVSDLEGALLAVQVAGGEIVRPIFAFPGGRRFQFRDPSGNELAVMQAN